VRGKDCRKKKGGGISGGLHRQAELQDSVKKKHGAVGHPRKGGMRRAKSASANYTSGEKIDDGLRQ